MFFSDQSFDDFTTLAAERPYLGEAPGFFDMFSSARDLDQITDTSMSRPFVFGRELSDELLAIEAAGLGGDVTNVAKILRKLEAPDKSFFDMESWFQSLQELYPDRKFRSPEKVKSDVKQRVGTVRAQYQLDSERTSVWGKIGAFGGSATAAIFDPATAPFFAVGAGAGATIKATIGIEAAIGGTSEAVLQPFKVSFREDILGEKVTATDIAGDILEAAAVSGAFAGALRGAGKAFDRGTKRGELSPTARNIRDRRTVADEVARQGEDVAAAKVLHVPGDIPADTVTVPNVPADEFQFEFLLSRQESERIIREVTRTLDPVNERLTEAVLKVGDTISEPTVVYQGLRRGEELSGFRSPVISTNALEVAQDVAANRNPEIGQALANGQEVRVPIAEITAAPGTVVADISEISSTPGMRETLLTQGRIVRDTSKPSRLITPAAEAQLRDFTDEGFLTYEAIPYIYKPLKGAALDDFARPLLTKRGRTAGAVTTDATTAWTPDHSNRVLSQLDTSLRMIPDIDGNVAVSHNVRDIVIISRPVIGDNPVPGAIGKKLAGHVRADYVDGNTLVSLTPVDPRRGRDLRMPEFNSRTWKLNDPVALRRSLQGKELVITDGNAASGTAVASFVRELRRNGIKVRSVAGAGDYQTLRAQPEAVSTLHDNFTTAGIELDAQHMATFLSADEIGSVLRSFDPKTMDETARAEFQAAWRPILDDQPKTPQLEDHRRAFNAARVDPGEERVDIPDDTLTDANIAEAEARAASVERTEAETLAAAQLSEAEAKIPAMQRMIQDSWRCFL